MIHDHARDALKTVLVHPVRIRRDEGEQQGLQKRAMNMRILVLALLVAKKGKDTRLRTKKVII
jgi:hypothetical protein